MTETRIADFAIGRPIEGVFAVLRAQRKLNRNGDTYLVVELSDQTGTIEGRVWENAEHFASTISVGDRVRVVGRPSEFRGRRQLEIRRIAREDAGPGEVEPLLPSARRDRDELAGELDFLCDEVGHPFFRHLLEGIWQGAERASLLKSPATMGEHHAYLGGLVEHTVAVAAMCSSVTDRHEHINRELLLAGALLHDIGRAREITIADTFRVDERGGPEAHILLAHEMLLEVTSGLQPNWRSEHGEMWARLTHLIASHHGPADRARGTEATILLAMNQLDARVART